METKYSGVARRAWKLLRLALLWARKGGVFKRRLMTELRAVPEFLKSLGHTAPARGRIYYGERELSFDKTPIVHVRMHRSRSASFRFICIPCITPPVDLDFDFDGESSHNQDDEVYEYDGYEDYGRESRGSDRTPVGEEGIDLRAEKFIARFYEQMKLQRQTSYLEYHQ